MVEAAKALLLMRAEMVRREADMSAALDGQVQSLRCEVERFRAEITAVVGEASQRIAGEARRAMLPVAAEYERAVGATSAHLQAAGRMVWLWFAAAGAILLLVLLVGWLVLGLQRRELAQLQDELQRHEHAIPIVRAFHASDAVLCDGRVCINADAASSSSGGARGYTRAKPRAPQPGPAD